MFELTPQEKAELTAFVSKLVRTPSLSTQENYVAELLAAQGEAVDIGGYYLPDDDMAERAMRPSSTLNATPGSV